MVSMIRNLVLRRSIVMGGVVFLALLLVVGVVSALFIGTAASTANTVAAVGTDIQVRDADEAYAPGVTASLSAQFRTNTQEVFAGFIDVKNNGVEALDNGYTIANAANPSPTDPEDVALSDALFVVIETTLTTLVDCAPNAATIGQTVVQTETAWSTLNTATITAINAPGAEQRLCFYLKLVEAADTVSGGEVLYDLTFTAS